MQGQLSSKHKQEKLRKSPVKGQSLLDLDLKSAKDSLLDDPRFARMKTRSPRGPLGSSTNTVRSLFSPSKSHLNLPTYGELHTTSGTKSTIWPILSEVAFKQLLLRNATFTEMDLIKVFAKK